MPSEYEQIAALQAREQSAGFPPVEHTAMQRAVVIQMTELMREDKWATFRTHVEVLKVHTQELMTIQLQSLGTVVGEGLMRAQLEYREYKGRLDAYLDILGLPELIVSRAPKENLLTTESADEGKT